MSPVAESRPWWTLPELTDHAHRHARPFLAELGGIGGRIEGSSIVVDLGP